MGRSAFSDSKNLLRLMVLIGIEEQLLHLPLYRMVQVVLMENPHSLYCSASQPKARPRACFGSGNVQLAWIANAGFVCLELYKVVQGVAMEKYRNTFANLALPLFAMSEPMPSRVLPHESFHSHASIVLYCIDSHLQPYQAIWPSKWCQSRPSPACSVSSLQRTVLSILLAAAGCLPESYSELCNGNMHSKCRTELSLLR